MSIFDNAKQYMYHFEQEHGELTQEEYTKMLFEIYLAELNRTPPPKFDSKGKKRG